MAKSSIRTPPAGLPLIVSSTWVDRRPIGNLRAGLSEGVAAPSSRAGGDVPGHRPEAPEGRNERHGERKAEQGEHEQDCRVEPEEPRDRSAGEGPEGAHAVDRGIVAATRPISSGGVTSWRM